MTTPRAELDITQETARLEALAELANRGSATKTSHSQDVNPGEKYVVCLVKVNDFFEQAERDALAPAIEALSGKIDDVQLVMEAAVPSDDLSSANRHWRYVMEARVRADKVPVEEPAE